MAFLKKGPFIMMSLNLRELIFIVAGITLLSGFLMIYLRYTAAYIKGPLQWAIGSFFVGGGLLIYGFYPWPGEYFNLLITNLTAFIGQCFFLIAIWKFKDKPVNYYFVLGLPLMTLLVTTYFTLFNFHMGLRVAINSVLYAAYAGYCFYELLTPPDRSLKLIFRINALGFLIYGLAMITRAMVSFSQKEMDLMAPTPESVILFSTLSLSEIILTFGFIIMVNIRLSQDMVRQIAMKDKFFSIIAHDLKNPMNNILGFSDLLSLKFKDKMDEDTEYISRAIRESVIQTNILLENLLEWALSQTGKVPYSPEAIDLRSFIKEESEFYMAFAENKQLKLDTEGISDLAIKADKNMLKTILRNLFTNAIKYSHPGDTIFIGSVRNQSMAEISVTDKGVGMDKRTIENLFSPYEKITTRGTRDEKGSGLGLVLCKEFVEKHHGKIWVRSEPGNGASFHFTLPLYKN
jgi:signal transduction histidine kinase